MSISVQWRPVKPGKSIDLGSSEWVQLEDLFGSSPVLSDESLPTLRGFRAALTGNRREAIDDLIEAIEKHGEIELFAIY